MSNLEARLARLEQQFSVLLANPNTRPALRSATAVPVNDAALTYGKIAPAAVTTISTTTQTAAATSNTPLSGGSIVVGGFPGVDLVSGSITFTPEPYKWVYAYKVYSASPASLLGVGKVQAGVVLILSKSPTGGDITCVDGVEFRLAGNCTISSPYDTLTVVSQAGDGWVEVARSVNG